MEEVWTRIIEDQNQIRYKQAGHFSPYCESVADSINQMFDGTTQITINTFYRFDDIFLPLFAREDISESIREWLLDCMMHLLTRLELRSGVDARECATRIKWAQIESGNFGKKLKYLFERLPWDKRYIASWYMEQQENNRESVTMFAKALIGILRDGVLYKDKENPKELLLYIGREENEEFLNEIEFSKEAFLPFGYRLRIFWKSSFGIIGDDRCMQIGDIEIY